MVFGLHSHTFTCVCMFVYMHGANIQLSIFVQRFFNEGPGAVGIDMDDGIKLMERYSDQFKLLEQQRHEFGNEQHTPRLTAPPMPVSPSRIRNGCDKTKRQQKQKKNEKKLREKNTNKREKN